MRASEKKLKELRQRRLDFYEFVALGLDGETLYQRKSAGDQRQHWAALVLLEIEPSLRRIKGCRHLPRLQEALQRELKIAIAAAAGSWTGWGSLRQAIGNFNQKRD